MKVLTSSKKAPKTQRRPGNGGKGPSTVDHVDFGRTIVHGAGFVNSGRSGKMPVRL
jgi:hypothetical protein